MRPLLSRMDQGRMYSTARSTLHTARLVTGSFGQLKRIPTRTIARKPFDTLRLPIEIIETELNFD